jgi:hypothetical protein
MKILAALAASAALFATVAAAQTQTPNVDQSQMDRAQSTQPPPAGRGGAVGTTGDATSGSGALRREQQPKNTPVAPGTGGGREGQVPQMDRN